MRVSWWLIFNMVLVLSSSATSTWLPACTSILGFFLSQAQDSALLLAELSQVSLAPMSNFSVSLWIEATSIWHVNHSPLTYYHPQWGCTLSFHAGGWWCYWTIFAPVYYWSPVVQPIFTSPNSPVLQPLIPQLLSKSAVETVLKAFLKPSSLLSTAPPLSP